MTNTELKAAVAEKFAKDGIWLNTALPLREIARKVEEHTGQRKRYSEGQFDFLFRFTGIANSYTSGRYVPPFRPLASTRHPREDDIERSQPPFMTPRGAIGNGSENSPAWRR